MLLESKEEIASMPKTFCIMMPSARTGMLLKCVANCDILLPLSSSLCIQKESEEIKNEVDSLLLRVNCIQFRSNNSTEIGNETCTIALQYNTIKHNTVQCSTAQYNAVRYKTVQCSTVQYSAV